MLIEDVSPKQTEEKLSRRWFSDNEIDLIIWENSSHKITDFQLCYDKQKDEHALIWKKDDGFEHYKVDEGEPGPLKNLAPIMIDDGRFDIISVKNEFFDRSKEMDVQIREQVISILNSFSDKDLRTK